MSIRVSLSLAVSLAVAGAGCTDSVTKATPAPFTRAVYDSERPLIPTPNDLALQAAPGVTDPATRGALFALINQGGFSAVPSTTPGTLGSLSVISVPYELVTAGIGSTPAGGVDASTVTASTVAIIRVTGEGAPQTFAPALVANVPGQMLMLPIVGAAPGGYVPGTRYVVAVRGGPNGVKTADGEEIYASTPISLVTDPNINFDSRDTRPASLSDEQAADLKSLKLVLTAPLNWMRVASDAICRAALGIPAGAPFEGVCWLPDTLGAEGVVPVPAFTAVETVFPVTEAISIQTFEIAPAP